MHWVDMQWLWGYDVLPGSIDDMLAYCKATGVKGNINFDGIGYEKLASEAPEHLQKLRSAIADGTIEVVGGSYGQPYGLFHGGESNIRQRVYGVRTAMRVLGCRPKTFWEEEFDFYPQLPQMLVGCGFSGAALYFQWTWHTPEVPMEEAPVVQWEGHDGTQIPTATRNRMNLHQWPEDFQIFLDDLAANPPSAEDGIPPLVLQWLELMPTQDWMCRSELMIPMLAKLKADPRFEVLAVTLGEYLAKWTGKELPVRKYEMDDVWHGMTLGKNGDNHPKRSAELEHRILEAEAAAAILGLFGRPYHPWDVYSTWEFEECWRQLLAAQHHDNHECEGLCGHVAEAQFAFIDKLLTNGNTIGWLARRVGGVEGDRLIFNRHGWKIQIDNVDVPAMGYWLGKSERPKCTWTIENGVAHFEEGGMVVRIDVKSATILELTTAKGSLKNLPLTFVYQQNGKEHVVNSVTSKKSARVQGRIFQIEVGREELAWIWFEPEPETSDLYMSISVRGDLPKGHIDPGYAGAVRLRIPIDRATSTIRTDGPYSVQTVGAGSSGKRKYPEGDWMTSPQWFESIEGAFTSQSFVDIAQPNGSGMQISHTSNQQWFLTKNGIENVFLASDPWDGDVRKFSAITSYKISLHQGSSNAECIKRSATAKPLSGLSTSEFHQTIEHGLESPPLPRQFSAVTVHSPNVLATAFYREQETFCARGLETYVGKGMGHPYILRLVEYDGIDGEVEVTLPGPIAKALKTNMMGEIVQELTPVPDRPTLLTTEPEKLKSFGIEAARLTVPMRGHEIATIYLDIVPGRKKFRDLDAKREIWATVHRTEDVK